MIGLLIWIGAIWLGIALAVAWGLGRWFRFFREIEEHTDALLR